MLYSGIMLSSLSTVISRSIVTLARQVMYATTLPSWNQPGVSLPTPKSMLDIRTASCHDCFKLPTTSKAQYQPLKASTHPSMPPACSNLFSFFFSENFWHCCGLSKQLSLCWPAHPCACLTEPHASTLLDSHQALWSSSTC